MSAPRKIVVLAVITATVLVAGWWWSRPSIFEILNHNPIEFYGRAVDQSGDPVPWAAVRGTVLINTGTRGGQMRTQTTTDAQGYFQFTGLKGQDLGMAIVKEGYEFQSRNSAFSYTYFEADHKRHIPDAKNPVVFVLWKKRGAEAMVHYGTTWRFPVNAEPIRIDLVTGKITPDGGDLIVTVSRDPLAMPFGTMGFEWRVIVEVVGGGLIEAPEQDYYNEAPSSGYQPRFEQKQAAQNPRDRSVPWAWTEGVKKDFFVSSRNGQNFARVHLSIRPNLDHNEGDNLAGVSAGVWLNPNGSRNLEIDRAKTTSPLHP